MIYYHTYRKGECLIKIAKQYNVRPEDIAEQNGITNIDFLIPGQKLRIEVEENECSLYNE